MPRTRAAKSTVLKVSGMALSDDAQQLLFDVTNPASQPLGPGWTLSVCASRAVPLAPGAVAVPLAQLSVSAGSLDTLAQALARGASSKAMPAPRRFAAAAASQPALKMQAAC